MSAEHTASVPPLQVVSRGVVAGESQLAAPQTVLVALAVALKKRLGLAVASEKIWKRDGGPA